MKNLLHATFHAIFWFCNITFLLVFFVGIFPANASHILKAALSNSPNERELFITLAVPTVISIICTVLGLRRFRKQPLQLIRLFYGVEAPLFLLCILFLFLRQGFRIRLAEFTPASALILGTVGVCMVAFYLEVLYGYAKRHRAIAWLQMSAHSLMPGVGVYLGLLLLFYAAPAAVFLLFYFFQFQWVRDFGYIWTSGNWWMPVSFMLFCVSVVLSLFMPWILASYYIQSGQRILRAFSAQYGRNRTVIGSGTVVTVWMILCLSFNAQPQIQAFKLLENPAPSDSQKAALVAKSDLIRDGLLNAYFSSYRYLGTAEENDHIRAIYESVFGLPESVSQFFQDSYNHLMSPFFYNGSERDMQKAGKLYAQFFDKPIQKAEREAIQHALQSTDNLGDAKAGLLNINQEKVLLRSQQVTVKPQGDWADVELYEVYANQTTAVEEIFYSFSLPESAAITGVWLGDSENLAKRFPFKVSPRGAAQKVYTSQVRRWRPVDPALLEQVGPLQYRLRAFPIPPRLSPQEQAESENQPTEMHLWLTYKVMRQEKGWALPQLGEKRNIFWNQDTQRIRNGEVVSRFGDEWLEPFLPAAGQYQPSVHQVNLANGYQISAKPLAAKDYSMPQGKRFAVILDASRSMATHTRELGETLSWLEQNGFADNIFANNDADLYISASPGAKPQRIDDISRFNANKMTFYGSIQPKEMLRQFTQMRGDTPYDGILLVTDESGYELSDNRKDVPVMPAPLWVVHLGSLSPAYDDATLKAIQDSGGGVCTKISEVLERQATKAALGSSVVSVVDGYAWVMEKVEGNNQSANTTQKPDNKGFEALAARQMVLGLSKKIDGKQIAQLDAIHAIAKTYKIVTPYSSMIVLVNDEQREALRIAEAQKDRFKRLVEDGKEQLRQPNNRFSASVPEPSTIIGLVAIALFLIRSRPRSVKLP
ncbi:TIGR02921 family PEP-CTERM protein [Coleofasciculus sp. FACHB-1120]|uniref:TIGR02921 family PEP-CTERM protein n=1 Tax=Coleofasciculus sp. FACHB-1120 TaxID=2692783 RepID=UPI00168826D0|nr:TIGR02921 family PEP-CTERM protein [Coleofasciculus sp. FACHB-1120]MBD2742308.1 TIGR02921 family PEP-CTERM protein [Coleofasciculus sp. FACHB-1120]